eukprot:CAMPEP_0116117024 /NCGR_PEP_ID=MMETSP0329-20121206/1350_1 /TAXON_ID=697910 /ORGANISM="Pseudo-nitzschia arenysensis, Strain B593" /LENGTH=568 /DNA_ID=CAMNT_0003610557 /DNA_START=329 /DNA_END=2035 /DNA_ORIENTATION=-
MIFRSTTLTFAVLLALEAPGSNAFQNGNTPPTKPATSNAPMPFKWPVVGTLPDFLNRGGVDGMSGVYESMYKEYGPTYGMSIMGEDETIFSDPRVFDQVLRKEGIYPVGGAESVTTFRDYYTENEMGVALKSIGRGPEWKEWRLNMNPDLYVLWETYLPSIADTCREISSLAGKEVTETKNLHVVDFLSRAAFDMFSTVLYGESPQTTNSDKAKAEDIAFVAATKRAFDISGNLIASPLDKIFGSDLYKEFVVNMDKTFNFAKERGAKKIEVAMDTKAKFEASLEESGEESSSSSSSSGCPISAIQSKVAGLGRKNFVPSEFQNPSFIERLVNREAFSKEDLAEVQGPLLMAGVDTTAYVMGWFYLNMASNPEVQTKLANELYATLKGGDVTTVDQMESLHYLKNCFRESHRLTPPAAISVKTLDRTIDVFSPLDERSYNIPEGQRVSLNLRGLPMDPKYVENPAVFSPERFSPENVEARKGTPSEIALDHPYMNDPFGRGKRRCLGANIAIAEMTVLAARLLQDWEITLEDPNEAVQSPTKTWNAKQKLLLIADPYPNMKFTPRKFD